MHRCKTVWIIMRHRFLQHLGKIGLVDSITENGDVSIIMEDGAAKWVVNPQILETVREIDTSFKVVG